MRAWTFTAGWRTDSAGPNPRHAFRRESGPACQRRTFRIDGQLPKLSGAPRSNRRRRESAAFGSAARRNGPNRARRRYFLWRLNSKSQFPNPRETFKEENPKCACLDFSWALEIGISLDFGF